MRLVPLKDDGTPDIDALNAEFSQEYLVDKRNPRWVAKPTVAYLWARTVTCKNCRGTVPFLKTRWLCKNDRKRVLLSVEPNAENTGVDFGIEKDIHVVGGNAARRREHDKRLGTGTMSRAGAKCPCCPAIMTMKDIRIEGKGGRMGVVPTAVVLDGPGGKEYRLPTELERSFAANIDADIERVYAGIPFGLPTDPTPDENALGMRIPKYGFKRWCDLFTQRQQVALGVFARQIRAFTTGNQVVMPDLWREAISAYLAVVLDKTADYSSTVCTWHNSGEKIRNTFARFALPMTWDLAELATINSVGGAWLAQLDWVTRYLEHGLQSSSASPEPRVLQQSATRPVGRRFDLVVTDPPYYDAIPYSDCMDFFHVWLRRVVHGTCLSTTSAFNDALSPKWDHVTGDGELIDDANRHGGDRGKSKQTYEEGMANAFAACHQALEPDGRMVIVFAHKQPDAWETLVTAMIRAGFVVDGSWPMQTEMGTRVRAISSAALASSVWLVCKKRLATARPGWDNKVLDEMRGNVTTRLREYWDAGIRGPDFVWAATGPALEAYSKHPIVKKANDPGNTMEVGKFLSHVRRMVVDFVVGQVLAGDDEHADLAAADRMDAPTAYYLLHRHDFGLEAAPSGACILYATACGLSDRDLETNWDLLVRTGASSTGQDESDENEGADVDTEGDPDDVTDSGSKVKLKAWAQRKHKSMGYEAPSGQPVPLIDRIHRLMHLWRAGDVLKVDEYLDDNGLRRQELFKRLLQSLIELSPAGSEERSLLESLSNHVQAKGATREQAPALPFEE